MSDPQLVSGSGAAAAAPEPETAVSPGATRVQHRWPELLLAISVLAIGIVTILDGMSQPVSTSASGLGAGQFPMLVGTFTSALGALLIIQVLRGRLGSPDAAEGDVDITRLHWWQLLLAAAALVFFALTVDVLGYPVAAAITFIGVAVATGARRWLMTIAIGIIMSLGVFYLFTLLLRIQLPAGILTGVL
ncbi:tripartite tricarboxylate transporter TctB family protein [Agrococcus sp. KRD186]|uniref:tripartite tricarboxylate transporter TctB family protein n=1 Tax=Agrococcus sp. KRD186 TaxID=2729730 RepID=UPI0019D00EB8|nr:tripartite tricarboxylate transporter TctB family protein [Agrococcus sp. KRD186]